jgi:gamma-glutamylputrescine oxidase
MLSQGFAASHSAIAARVGADHARALQDLSREGVEMVLENTRALGLPGVDPRRGVYLVSRHPDAQGMQAYQRASLADAGREYLYLPTEALREEIFSTRFHDGLYDHNGYHIHPLNYCVGLARVAADLGAEIFENSAMTSMELNGPEKLVHCAGGTIRARRVILCSSGYTGPEFGKLRHLILPIATYAVSTAGLGSLAAEIMRTEAAIADTRLSCDYFRITPAGELLWGGGMSALNKVPPRLAQLMKDRITEVFPQLKEVRVEPAWTGLMGYTRHKMPYLHQLRPNVWTLTGLGGHGLNTGPILARVLAEAITLETQRYKLFEPFGLHWNGGPFGPLVADGICAISNFRHQIWENRAG